MGELSTNFLNKIYNSSNIAIGIANLDGYIIDSNEAFSKIIGYSKDELIHIRYQDITPSNYHKIDEQVVDLILNQDQTMEYEKELITKDGTHIPLLLNSLCLRNVKGHPVALAATVQKISRYKSYYHELNNYKNKFHGLLNVTHDIVCELNSKFRFLCISPNSRDYVSYEPSELVGRDLLDYIHRDDLSVVKSIIENSIRNFSAAFCLVRFKSKAGQWLLKDCNITPYKSTNGEIKLIVSMKSISHDLVFQNKVQKQDNELKNLSDHLDLRIKDLNILYKVTKAVHQSLDLREVYTIAMDMMIEFDNVDMVFMYLVDRDRKEAILETHRNVPEGYIKRVSRIPRHVGITWKIIETGKHLNISDIQYNEDAGPGAKELGHHGVLGIPLTMGNKVIGVLYFASYKSRKFDHNEVSLFSSISDHLSVAISKATLYEELRKKNKSEKIIISITTGVHQSLDLKRVLQRAAELITRCIDNADHVAIYMLQDKKMILSAYTANDDINTRLNEDLEARSSGVTWKILNERKSVLYNTIDPENENVLDFIKSGSGIRSFLGMPVRYKNHIIGAINITSFKKNAFEKGELGLFKIVTRQIESAINNAKMAEALGETEKKYRDLYENVPAGIYRKSFEGRIFMANRRLIQMLGFNSFDEMVSIYQKHSDFLVECPSVKLNKILKEKSKITELESTWLKYDGSYINVIESVRAIYDRDGEFLYFEGTVTNITERKEAESKLKASRESLRKLTEYLEQYREEERTAIAREIHDEFAQILTGMAIDLTWLTQILPGIVQPESRTIIMDKIENFSVLVNDAFESVKKICGKLRPKVLDDLGIEAAIKWQIDTVKSQTDINFEFNSYINGSWLDPKVSTAVFRIFQESLTNILRHAEATKVTVSLQQNGNYIVLCVNDNGKGITESSIYNVDSLGLQGIRERANSLSGDVRIKGMPGGGTSIIVRLPFKGR